MNDNTLKNRVKKFLETERVSNSEFAQRAGVTPAYIYAIKKNIGIPILQKLVEINPAVNLSWLLFGVGSMYNNDTAMIDNLQRTNRELSDKVAMLQKIVSLYERTENGTK